MVGVSVAWHLARRGHDVTLVDRREPGRETSFGNAGIIQREAVRPYPFPRDLGTLWRVLPNRQVDIRYRPGGMLESAGPLWQYWKNSSPDRYRRIVPEYASLIERCLDAHGAMIEAAGAESLVRREGWLELYRRQSALEARLAQAEENAAQFGVRYRALDAAALADMEPSLGEGLAGAIHWLDPWTVADPGALVSAYAEAFEREGGRIVKAEVDTLSGAMATGTSPPGPRRCRPRRWCWPSGPGRASGCRGSACRCRCLPSVAITCITSAEMTRG